MNATEATVKIFVNLVVKRVGNDAWSMPCIAQTIQEVGKQNMTKFFDHAENDFICDDYKKAIVGTINTIREKLGLKGMPNKFLFNVITGDLGRLGLY